MSRHTRELSTIDMIYERMLKDYGLDQVEDLGIQDLLYQQAEKEFNESFI